MTNAVIERNLSIFRERSVVSYIPVEGWEYRLARYRERQDYEYLTDWQPLDRSVMLNTADTFFGRASFTPTAPGEGQTAYLELCTGSGCEAFVKVNGTDFAGVNNDQGRNRVYLPKETYGSKTGIEIELFASNHARGERDVTPIPGSAWVISDDVVASFAFGMSLLWDVIRRTDLPYKKDKLQALLEKVIRMSDQSLDGDEYRENTALCAEALESGLREIGSDDDLGVIECIASTHIDVAWLWQYKDTIRKSGRAALNQFRIMDRYPEFEFSMSQPSVYNFIKEVYPDVFEEIKRRVAAGSWQLVGPMWVESDLNLSGAETLIREYLYGHRFFMREFGKSTDMCWIPDSFGFPANLPQIFSKCGMKYFYTTKVRWQAANDFPYNVFIWEGLDHSRLLSTIPKTEAYYNGFIGPSQLKYASDNMQQKGLWDRTLFVYGFGDGGGGPTEQMLEHYRRLKDYPGMPKTHLTRADNYFGELEKISDRLPVWKGELCVETHQGTYSTIAENKRSNRKAEMAYRRLDLLAAMAGIKADSDEYAGIVKYWKDLLLMQFHDVLPGSSINAVYDDTARMYKEVFDFADSEQKALEEKVFRHKDDPDAVTVFNPNSFVSTAYVPVGAEFAGGALTDGESVSDVVPDGKGGYLFLAKDVPGFTCRVFRRAEPENAAPRVKLCENDGGIAADTPFFSFTVMQDGTLHDFRDKRSGFVWSQDCGLNRFVCYKDGPEIEDAWNIDKEYKLRPVDLGWEDKISVAVSDGDRAVIRVTKFNGRTTLTQDIVVYADIARVDFLSHIDWQEKYKILQVSFPVAVEAPQASYEVQYGFCTRPTHANTPAERWKHEYAAHRFIDLSDDVRGAALLNDCKYGHNVIDSDMIITLFRSTDYPSKFYDMGEHDFAYSFLPHEGRLAAGGVPQQGYLFNSPMLVMKGDMSAEAPVTVCGGMIIDCVKPAEDGRGIIVRAYEPFGVSGKASFTLPKAACVTEESPLEEKISDIGNVDSFDIEYKPFEFRTFRIN